MKRFLIERDITDAGGTQTFYVDAETEDEAMEKHRNGEGEIYASECEVTNLGEPVFAGETSLDDDGDFAQPK